MTFISSSPSTEMFLGRPHCGIKTNKVPYMGCQSLLYQSKITKESYVRQETCRSSDDYDYKPLSIPTSILIHQESPQSIPSFSTYCSDRTYPDKGCSSLHTFYDIDILSNVYDIPPNDDSYAPIQSENIHPIIMVPSSCVRKRSSLPRHHSRNSSSTSLNATKNLLSLCVGNRSPNLKRSFESAITLPDVLYSADSNRDSVFLSLPKTIDYQPVNSWEKFFSSFSLRSHNTFFWTRSSLKKPVLNYVEKNDWKAAIRSFKVIQKYMGDRRTRKAPSDLISILNLHVSDQESLRDEILIQICKQTIKNPDFRSRSRGWELLAECLLQFSPSSKLLPYLDGYILSSMFQERLNNSVPINNCLINLQKCEFNMSLFRGILTKEMEQKLESSIFLNNYRKRSFSENIQLCTKEQVSFFNQSLQSLMKQQSFFMPSKKVPIVLSILCNQVAKDLEENKDFLSLFRSTFSHLDIPKIIVKLDKWCCSICVSGIPETEVMCPDISIVALQILVNWFETLASPVISQQMAFITTFSLKDLSKANKRVVSFVAEFLLIHVVRTSKDTLRNMASFLCTLIFQLPKDKFYPYEEPTESVYLNVAMKIFHCLTA